MKAGVFEVLVHSCKAGLLYSPIMLVYKHVIIKDLTRVHNFDFTFFEYVSPLMLVVCLGGLLGSADAYIQRIPTWLLAAGTWVVLVVPLLLFNFVAPKRYNVEP